MVSGLRSDATSGFEIGNVQYQTGKRSQGFSFQFLLHFAGFAGNDYGAIAARSMLPLPGKVSTAPKFFTMRKRQIGGLRRSRPLPTMLTVERNRSLC
jgi:hypothetical protein